MQPRQNNTKTRPWVDMTLVVPILLVLMAVTGCGSSSYITPTQAEELSLDYQADFMRDKQLARTFSRDLVEFYKEYDLNEEARKLNSGRQVSMKPLRTSSVPYEEIEHLVRVYKTDLQARQAFSEWNEPKGEWFLSWARQPSRYDSMPTNVIGDESKVWRTSKGEFITVFRKGKVLEAMAVKYSYVTFLGHLVYGKDMLPLEDERLLRWALEPALKAESSIPNSYTDR